MSRAVRNPLPSDRFRALVANPVLRERFLPPMTAAEIAAVERLLDPVVEEAACWRRSFPMLPSGLILPTALATIVQLSDVDPRGIAIRVVETLWIAAFDDLFDRDSLELSQLVDLARRCRAVCCGVSGDERLGGPYEVLLSLIRDKLSHYSSWPDFEVLWSGALSRLIDGMVYQRCGGAPSFSAGRHFDLSLSSYLEYAKHTLGLPQLYITSLVVENRSMSQAALSDLVRLAEQCGLVMRLANDLSTYRREFSEDNTNAVTLLAAQNTPVIRTLSEPALIDSAVSELRRVMAEEVVRAHQMSDSVVVEKSSANKFIRGMEFGVEMYRRIDFREWSSEFDQRTREIVG